MEIINFSTNLEASESRRVIAGKIVPFENEIGDTSAGKVIFEKGSIEIEDVKAVKLLLEHDPKQPIGRMRNVSEDESGIYAEFKVSNTTRGTDSLIEASENLRSGLSVGVEVIKGKNTNGVYRVSSARLLEVSLVQAAAFRTAEVLSVAASTDAGVSTETKTETEEIVDYAINGVVSATEVETPAAVVDAPVVEETPAVDASRPTVRASLYTKPRLEFTKEKFLENTLRAQYLNDDSARQYISAAADTTDNSGLIPTRQLTEIINPLTNADRPFIDSISSGALPDAGMTFEIPKLTQAPTVAETAEGAAPSDTDQNISFLSVNVKKYAGQQTFSVELLDRSSPAFFSELVRLMEQQYAAATDAAVGATLTAVATDGGNRTLTAANIQDFIADAAVSVYSGTLGFAQNIVVSPDQWGALMGLVDGSNRAVFTQTINPQNASGNLTPTNIRGNIGGLNLRVSRYLGGTGDGSMIIVNPDSFTWYESTKYRLETNLISTGQIQVAYYGYGAIANKVNAGAYKWMVA
jgi:HK97 family phage prohead protease/HK97 family phage major capsid protein